MNSTWIVLGGIPAERMKNREPHIVPLSSQAVELLRELATHTGGRRQFFPNLRNRTNAIRRQRR